MPKQKVSKNDLANQMRDYLLRTFLPDIHRDFAKGIKSKKYLAFKNPKFKHLLACLALVEYEINKYLTDMENQNTDLEKQSLLKLWMLVSNFNADPKANKDSVQDILDTALDWITNYAPIASSEPKAYFLCETLLLTVNLLEIELKDNYIAASLALGKDKLDAILKTTPSLSSEIQRVGEVLAKRMSAPKSTTVPAADKSILEHYNDRYLAILSAEGLDQSAKLTKIKDEAVKANECIHQLLENRKKLKEIKELKILQADLAVYGFQGFFNKDKSFIQFSENNRRYKVLYELLTEEEQQSLILKNTSRSESNRCLKKLAELTTGKVHFLEKNKLAESDLSSLVDTLALENPALKQKINDSTKEKELEDLRKANDETINLVDKYMEVMQEIEQLQAKIDKASYLNAEINMYIKKNDKWYKQLANFFKRFGNWFTTESLSEKIKDARFMKASLEQTQKHFKEAIQRNVNEIDSNPNISESIKEKLKQQLIIEPIPKEIKPAASQKKFQSLTEEFISFSSSDEEPESKANFSKS